MLSVLPQKRSTNYSEQSQEGEIPSCEHEEMHEEGIV